MENRLGSESSPYLQQHAKDPVDWQPWDSKALEEAERRDVPIFLSIGYSSCHWCHVMQKESFQDEKVASVLNKNFVSIKVDREERPDLDKFYQKICKMATGQGGWPLSVWITPELKPFYVGTFFPRESKYGRPGFVDVLERISSDWEEERSEIEKRADEWSDAVRGDQEIEVEEIGEVRREDLLSEAAESVFEIADIERGGFGSSGPKFPQTTWMELLFTAYKRFGKSEYKEVGIRSLEAMAKGGIRDHVGGGFHRYSTDPEWTVPHFEKMLYDNALISRAFLSGYQITGRDNYRKIAEETFGFLKRELYHPEGGFYSSLDARSEGQEGKFYVWEPSEIRKILEDETSADMFIDRYGIEEDGNFQGKNVLNISKKLEKIASKYERGKEEVEEYLKEAREKILRNREGRSPPLRDGKILAGWNGLLVSSLADWSPLIGRKYLKDAEETLKFIQKNLWDEKKRLLYRRYKDGDVSINGFLEDYAYLAKGSFQVYQITGDPNYLNFAKDLATEMKERFYEESTVTLYFTPMESEDIPSEIHDFVDHSTPSSVAVSLAFMIAIHPIFPKEGFEQIVQGVLSSCASRVRKSPLEHASLSMVEDLKDRRTLEITLIADEIPNSWLSKLSSYYFPDAVLYPRPRSKDGMEEWLDLLNLSELPMIWDREVRDEKPTLYVCGGQACSPPITEIDKAVEWAHKVSS
ncbi:thioredoxin domain containing protein [candidate division MSBL1 archaeon SCGC-AAA259I14]|uniref:Thioredoxin domain containing protein n=1 Tax=candidate division MSBL1 archaeon SCGC-AAA259I14 TaxID=1698268 RepID=A0A133UQU8_9EURY|nr:thioredoxin domain containing protein [candidate division MSBL1 archaeon SCGC-AAA259I14]